MSKHDAVWNWLYTCPHIKNLFFNYAQTTGKNDTQLIPSENVLETFIDGSKHMQYNVALIRYMAISGDPNDVQNISDLVDFEKVGEWVDAQNIASNFPEFPEGCIVEEVALQPNVAGFAVAQNMTMAKYMLQFTIDYIKEVVNNGRD